MSKGTPTLKANEIAKTTPKNTEDETLLLPADQIANPFMDSNVDLAKSLNSDSEIESVETPGTVEVTEAVPATAELEEEEPVMDLQEEIALWKYCAPDELYMLLKDDPSRFLPALEKDRELSQKHGCLVTREGGKLRIKYRIYPDDRWTECGYFEDFDDNVIYQEFAESVQRSLNMPRNRKDPKKMSRKDYIENVKEGKNDNRAHISAEIGADSAPTVANTDKQGDKPGEKVQVGDGTDRAKMLELKAQQMKKDDLVLVQPHLSKRTDKSVKPVKPVKAVEPVQTDLDQDPDTDLSDQENVDADDQVEAGSLNALLDAYLQQIISRIHGSVRSWLASAKAQNQQSPSYSNKGLEQLISNLLSIEEKVPANLVKEYRTLITNLSEAPTNEFYNFMVEQKQHFLPRHLEPIYDNFLMKIVSSTSLYLGKEWTHDKICQLLALGWTDIQLLKEHEIDLRELWNSSPMAKCN